MSKHHKNVPLCFFYTQKSAVHNILIDLFLKSSPPKGIKSYYFVDNKHTFSMSKLTNFFFALAFYTWQIQNLHKLTDKNFISSRQLLKFLEQEDIKQTYYKFQKKNSLYICIPKLKSIHNPNVNEKVFSCPSLHNLQNIYSSKLGILECEDTYFHC